MRRLAVLAALILVLAAVVGWTQRDWLIAKMYLGTLEHESRVEGLHIDRVIEALKIGPGDRVVDLGAGTGLFTWPLAEAVGADGMVYAVDINQELLTHIEEKGAVLGLSVVQTVLAAAEDPLIPEPVDLVFICNTLHHLPNQEQYLKTLRRYLQASGRVAVIDFDEGGPHFLHRYDEEEMDRWFSDAGYERAESFDFVEGNFFVVYQCRDCGAQ